MAGRHGTEDDLLLWQADRKLGGGYKSPLFFKGLVQRNTANSKASLSTPFDQCHLCCKLHKILRKTCKSVPAAHFCAVGWQKGPFSR